MAEATRKKKERLSLRFPFVQKGVRYGEVDVPFFLTVLALLVMGIIMMFSASYAWAIAEGNEGTYYAEEQIKTGAIGLGLMYILSIVDYRIYRNPIIAIGSYVVPVVLLILVLIVGTSAGGAQRWLVIGSFNFQPSELMKIGLVIFFAYLIEMNYGQMNKFRTGILPYLVALGIVAGLLMLEPHLSCTILIGLIGMTLIWVGGARPRHFLILIVAGIAAVLAIVAFLSIYEGYDYIQVRLQSWLDPFADSQGGTWQTCQSLIAIGSGGLFGLGLGESRQKFLYLPETKNDFVFSIVCEELGFVGALTVVLLFALLVFRGFRIATQAPDKFGMLLTVGFTMHIGLQAFLNIAVVSNLVPNTGISLPFFSYGGTALILQLAEMGVVMNISRARYKSSAYNISGRRKKAAAGVQPQE
ncbi:MAG: FtsW/RodA/SpoVE family cell cycle protein [Ruminococcus sp.]|nr:FtsW/RodA/SpoVE family cell cycle protein [Ruminococcus sp.]